MAENSKYSLERINYPKGDDCKIGYAVVDESGNWRSMGSTKAIYVDNHFVVTGGYYPEAPLHGIEKVYDGDVDIKIVERKVRDLAQRELEVLVKKDKWMENICCEAG